MLDNLADRDLDVGGSLKFSGVPGWAGDGPIGPHLGPRTIRMPAFSEEYL